MDSSILEYSMRSNKKLMMNLDAFIDFRVSLGKGMGVNHKSIFAQSSTFWSKLGGQVWRHDISIIKL